MVEKDVIVVGAGPAGSTCAWKLKSHGVGTLLLDKQIFPRSKLCAGWITPKVIADLRLIEDQYPYGIKEFKKLNVRLKGIKLPIPTKQYSIRRVEFDDWLVKRSGVQLDNHEVKSIKEEGGFYIIDEKYRCKYLIGAGGTGCRVYQALFKRAAPRIRDQLITSLEDEFEFEVKNENCYLWFFDHGLPGYAWYVPKENGYLNIGIGGKFAKMKKRGRTIRFYWNLFVEKLDRSNLVKGHQFSPKGYNYYLRAPKQVLRSGNAFLIGDAAGLATLDMGEGIGPAVESAILAAESIAKKKPFTLGSTNRFSWPGILFSR